MEERAQIPRIAALLPCWVFVCVWCESLQTTDLNNAAAAGCQKTWKGGKWSHAKEQHAGMDPTLTTVGYLGSPSSLSWRNHLQRVSRLYLISPRCVLADLVFLLQENLQPVSPLQGRERRRCRRGSTVIYLLQYIKSLALSFGCTGSFANCPPYTDW